MNLLEQIHVEIEPLLERNRAMKGSPRQFYVDYGDGMAVDPKYAPLPYTVSGPNMPDLATENCPAFHIPKRFLFHL